MPDLADRPIYADVDLEEAPRRSPRLGIAIAAVVIAASVAGVWYVYDRGVRRGDLRAPPVIAADTSPVKSSPADPGGMQIPNQSDELSNRRSGRPEAKVEQLLPPPERPAKEVELPPASPPVAAAPSPSATVPIAPPVAAVEVAPRPAVPPASPVAAAPSPPPVAARTEPKPEPKVEAKAPPSPAVATAPGPAAAAPAAKGPAAAAPNPTPASIAPAAGRAGGYRIQLAATPEAKAANDEWRRLSRAHADVLGGLSPNVAAVDLPGKGVWHRLSAGSFADRNAAAQVCETLKQRKVGCFVVAP